jgi:hypothetical protein
MAVIIECSSGICCKEYDNTCGVNGNCLSKKNLLVFRNDRTPAMTRVTPKYRIHACILPLLHYKDYMSFLIPV